MLDNDFACRELTELVRETVETSDALASKRHEQLFISLVRNQKQRRVHRRRVQLASGLAVLAAAAGLVIAFTSFSLSRDFSFVVGNSLHAYVPGEQGDWIQADAGETMEIRFDQGSRFRVKDGCAARIVEAGTEQVTIELSHGNIAADVKGNHRTNWKINAGPFTVTVLGTAFDVYWNSASNALDVKVERGAVLVQGAGLSRHGVRLLAGQQLAANGRSGEIMVKSPAKEAFDVPSPSGVSANRFAADTADGEFTEFTDSEKIIAAESEGASEGSEVNDLKLHGEKQPFSKASRGDWQSLYRSHQFELAIAAAEKTGLSKLYRTADAQSLWNLADAARNARRVAISNEALIALRKRFGTGNKARLSAFIIGRSAMDASHNLTVAAQWFQTYLAESPGGAMSEEVHGRLMTIYSEMARLDAAKRIAQQYLRQYPSGLYVDRAKQVLQR